MLITAGQGQEGQQDDPRAPHPPPSLPHTLLPPLTAGLHALPAQPVLLSV